MAIKDNIKNLRTARQLSQDDLAKAIGCTNKAVSTWEKGTREPRMGAIQKMADFFGVPKSVIIEDDPQDIYHLTNYVALQKKKIPLLGKVAAGEPIYADEHIEEYLPANEDVHADFALRIQGDSMINAGIEDGNIVFVKKQDEVEQGQIAVVLREDSATVKRFYRTETMIQLIAENPKYPPIIIQESDFQNVRILGRVTAVLKKL